MPPNCLGICFSFRGGFPYTALPLHDVLFDMLINTCLFVFILKAREEEMTAKVMDLQTQLEELQNKYQQRLHQEENPSNDKVRGPGLCCCFLKTLSFLSFDLPADMHTYLI